MKSPNDVVGSLASVNRRCLDHPGIAMTPERWDELDRVWHALLERPEPERAAAIDELCAEDQTLRRDIESLLAHLVRASAAGFGAAAVGIAGAHESLIGRQLGPYAVHTLLGAGGMGEVVQATDSTLAREVALKILPDLWLADPDRQSRFDREARLSTTAIRHLSTENDAQELSSSRASAL